ncbi:PREDICTED: uncharacterized protein LOC104729199 [Camelina sativa]|uniref:Uncharacterized protein LOC104729199 n=1 Tax=Camelina sativa TaxID=90675 RepID=A0ABM0UU57_CAMSA|nr:PREDICTED: uncharacterized protein LOC104729199 [Camelina sativa]XP_010446418.1 PREDICTED: uncharacterized protein LOC104729199 [Camelina sativa]
MVEGEDVAGVSLSVRNEEDLSPECLAWADSCIISFPDDSDHNHWGTFRDALTEIIDIHPEMFVPSSSGTTSSVLPPDEDMTESEPLDLLRSFQPEADSANNKYNSLNEEVSEIVSLITFESDPSKNSLQDHYFSEPIVENGTPEPVDDPAKDLGGVESIEEDESVSNEEAEEETESVSYQVFKDDFISTYIQENVEDCNVTEDPVKVTQQEIFKVWDLEIVGDDDEEDGLVLQLKKALDESSTVQPLPQPLLNDVAETSSIDDLIAGISDLSLAETFN